MKFRLYIMIFILIISFSACSDSAVHNDAERTTLSVLIFDRGDVPDGAGTITDNAMTRWIQKSFGDPNNIDISFVAIPRSSVDELNVLFASGDAPDIVFGYGMASMHIYNFQGYLKDLTDYVAKSDKIRNFVGEDLLEECKFDGKQYLIPSKRLIAGRQAQLVRKDWLDKLGLDVPRNKDDFYEMLCQFKEHDPGGNGEKNIPYGISSNTANYTDLVLSFMDVDFTDSAFMNCENLFSVPGYKEGVRFMNKLYNEGLISENFQFDTERKKVESDIAEGYVGFFCDDLGRPLQVGGVYEQLRKKIPTAELVAVDTWNASNGSYPKCIYDGAGLHLGVSSTCRYPENAIKYLEWMCDTQVLRTIQYGFEGISYEYDDNNCPVVIDSPESRINHWYNLGFDLSLVVTGKYSENPDEIVNYNAAATIDPELYKACYENSMRDGWVNRIVYLYSVPEAVNDSVKRNNLGKMILTDCITCPKEEFDKLFDSIAQEYANLSIDVLAEENYKFYNSRYVK